MNKTDKENEFDLVNCVQNNGKKFGDSFHDFDSEYSQRCGHGCGLKESDIIKSLKAELDKARELISRFVSVSSFMVCTSDKLTCYEADKLINKAKEFLKKEGE